MNMSFVLYFILQQDIKTEYEKYKVTNVKGTLIKSSVPLFFYR